MLNRRNTRILIIVGLVIGSIAGPAIAALLNNSVPVQQGVTIHAPDGPAVNITESGDVDLTSPFPDANTVQINSSVGNATLVSSGRTNASLDNINGTWTNVSGLDVATNELFINPEDKPAVNVSGDVETLDFRDMAVDDGNVDFVYSGTSGTTTVTVRGLQADTDIRAVDADTGSLLSGATTASDGTVTLSSMPNSEHEVELKTSKGGPGLSDPSPLGEQSTFPTEMSVDVSDPDFGNGENVTVEFYVDDSKLGENSTESAGTVTLSISQPARGAHDAKAVATDSNGNTKTLEWDFSIANNLTVREATNPWDKINDRDVTFTFYDGNETITEETVSDGVVNLTGLATNEDIVVKVEAEPTQNGTSAYHNRTVVIEDITKQSDVYLLNKNESSVEVRFTLQDLTGEFEGNNATLFVQKPVNRTGTPTWTTMHGDQFGVEGVTTDLVEGERYRLIVKNEDNDVRILGSYVADVTESVQLTIGTVEAVPDTSSEAFTYNASYMNSTTNYVKFEYNDTLNITDSVSVTIHEFGNESNVLFANQTFSGPLGTFSLSEPVASEDEDKSWVIEVTGTRDGEEITIREIVGPRRPVLGNMPGWLRAVISIGSIWVVAGLFSQINGDVGAVVIAGMGGMWWFVDFLPAETGVGVVVLALITAGIIFLNERRSSAL